jgi:hypothetical protein
VRNPRALIVAIGRLSESYRVVVRWFSALIVALGSPSASYTVGGKQRQHREFRCDYKDAEDSIQDSIEYFLLWLFIHPLILPRRAGTWERKGAIRGTMNCEQASLKR